MRDECLWAALLLQLLVGSQGDSAHLNDRDDLTSDPSTAYEADLGPTESAHLYECIKVASTSEDFSVSPTLDQLLPRSPWHAGISQSPWPPTWSFLETTSGATPLAPLRPVFIIDSVMARINAGCCPKVTGQEKIKIKIMLENLKKQQMALIAMENKRKESLIGTYVPQSTWWLDQIMPDPKTAPIPGLLGEKPMDQSSPTWKLIALVGKIFSMVCLARNELHPFFFLLVWAYLAGPMIWI